MSQEQLVEPPSPCSSHLKQEELDVEEEGGRLLYSEYQEILAVYTAGLSEGYQEVPAVIAGSSTTVVTPAACLSV
ncbi:uncharacterized protein ARMOST_20934 [Armillaria ostoyae]|uniref:Uncharacterized protein n=1 Tax=Armillaria ostoyae TaxID=47428 RepID=A0A284S8P7_ARMOS|nr:uncharacterized protein ARMOST_20934 [Armillaria ostoyae]